MWRVVATSAPELVPLKHGAWVMPIRELVLSCTNPSLEGCVRFVAVSGQWPQERLHRCGYVESPLRQTCTGPAGSLAHRHLDFPALETHKQQHLDPASMHATSVGWGGATFWNRALLPIAALPSIPRTTDERRQRYRAASQPYFAGHTFVDVSGHKRHWLPALNMVGWIAAQAEEGKLIAGVYGTVLGGEQTVPRSAVHHARGAPLVAATGDHVV